MKKMKEKVISLLAILACLCMMLTACGSTGSDTQEDAGQPDDAVEATEGEDEAEPESEEPEEDYLAEEGYTAEYDGYSTVTRWTSNGDKNIFGVFYLPEGFDENSTYPTIIMSHGMGGYIGNVEPYAERLASKGLVCYIFDFCAGSNNSRSDGAQNEFSVLTEVEDLKAVMDFVKGFDYVDKENLILFGESQGGFVTALTAAQRADEVKTAILFYPAFVAVDDFHELYPTAEDIPTEDTQYIGQMVGPLYFSDIYDMDIYAEIAAYEKPVLIVHGTNDNLVPYEYSEKAVEAYADAELKPIEEAGHGFKGSEERMDAATEYVVEHLQKLDIIGE